MPELADLHSCTGCSACASVCNNNSLVMVPDENGFMYPEFVNPDNCTKCGCCENVCPVLNPNSIDAQENCACAAYSINEDIRKQSSSGGVFTELAFKTIDEDGVVYGAAYGSDFSVQHICISSKAELFRLRGAKYSQSVLGNSFRVIRKRLENGQKVLFSGTPCQVAGLKAFLKKDYFNLITVDFVCHGIPSPMVWQAYIKYRAEQDADGQRPIAINLRSKHTGWSRYQYSNLYQYGNGASYSAKGSDDLFMKLFVGDYINRESCANCVFKGYDRVSDLTIGDFWGIWDIMPELDDDKGISVVLAHSQKGRDVLKDCRENLRIKLVTLEQTSVQNPSMLYVFPTKENRAEVLEQIRHGKIDEMEKLFSKQKQWGGTEKMSKKVTQIIRHFWKS